MSFLKIGTIGILSILACATAMAHPSTVPHVHVRDHRTGAERIQYLVNDVDMFYRFGDSRCDGVAQVTWTLRPIRLEPENRYHDAMNVHGKKTTQTVTRSYDLSLGCSVYERFTGLNLGIWQAEVVTASWIANCSITLSDDAPRRQVHFERYVSGCVQY